MRKLLLVLFSLAVVLAVVVSVRAVMLASSRQPVVPAAATVDHALATTVANHLAEAVRFQTISLSDTIRPDAALDAMRTWMETTYPKLHATLSREIIGEKSLVFTWKGTDASAPPLVLMAHMDVVPVEPGTEGKWTHGAFSGDIAEGFVWGRGALDDKLNVVGELEAIEALITANFVPRRTVILSFGHNEEVLGSGAKAIAAAFAERNIHPFLLVDEGGAVIAGSFPGLSRPVALVGIAEKGYVSVELIAESPGGHSSMPPTWTATGIVAAAVTKLEQNPMPARLNGATRTFFETLAPDLPFSARAVFGNLWLFSPLAKAFLARDPTSNAMIRTTTAPTMFEGSVKDNVLPARARAVVNFRILPGDSVATVLRHVTEAINDERVKVRALNNGGSNPSRVSDVHAAPYALLARTIQETMPDALVAPYVLIGATDSRHFEAVTPNIFRFSPSRIGPTDLARVHGTNERVGVDNLAELVTFYVKLVRNADAP